ncbi:MAG: hypothetical protein H8E66_17460 [Planctomycetes bacterium]|nr:hypothetical protein [Planctomycetota bacterium]
MIARFPIRYKGETVLPRTFSESMRRIACAFIAVGLFCNSDTFAAEPIGTSVRPGSSIDLFKAWPAIAMAPRSELATLEFLIHPDSASINRPRSFIMTLSNTGGRDAAGLGVTINGSSIRANVFGTLLDSDSKLQPDQWVHVALTVNTKTINKQATLWINGKRIAGELILEPWPASFEVAQMLSDKWNQGRVFSGQIGDIRISSLVRYEKPFDAPTALPADQHCVLHFAGDQIPLQ